MDTQVLLYEGRRKEKRTAEKEVGRQPPVVWTHRYYCTRGGGRRGRQRKKWADNRQWCGHTGTTVQGAREGEDGRERRGQTTTSGVDTQVLLYEGRGKEESTAEKEVGRQPPVVWTHRYYCMRGGGKEERTAEKEGGRQPPGVDTQVLLYEGRGKEERTAEKEVGRQPPVVWTHRYYCTRGRGRRGRQRKKWETTARSGHTGTTVRGAGEGGEDGRERSGQTTASGVDTQVLLCEGRGKEERTAEKEVGRHPPVVWTHRYYCTRGGGRRRGRQGKKWADIRQWCGHTGTTVRGAGEGGEDGRERRGQTTASGVDTQVLLYEGRGKEERTAEKEVGRHPPVVWTHRYYCTRGGGRRRGRQGKKWADNRQWCGHTGTTVRGAGEGGEDGRERSGQTTASGVDTQVLLYEGRGKEERTVEREVGRQPPVVWTHRYYCTRGGGRRRGRQRKKWADNRQWCGHTGTTVRGAGEGGEDGRERSGQTTASGVDTQVLLYEGRGKEERMAEKEVGRQPPVVWTHRYYCTRGGGRRGWQRKKGADNHQWCGHTGTTVRGAGEGGEDGRERSGQTTASGVDTQVLLYEGRGKERTAEKEGGRQPPVVWTHRYYCTRGGGRRRVRQRKKWADNRQWCGHTGTTV